ncbi:reverse transcriptase [Senna tora]|uniref:Reverse transcriptase n=1 Tax=Senna tora TaxID=362788 RepID=A0A835CGQ0_9FABA|nr:reverse transcriptase [Senna tora]
MEQTDSALEAQCQWIQHRFGNEFGLTVNRAYFVPEASRFRNIPHRRTTFVRALWTCNGYVYRPRRFDPIDFEFDPWAPMDEHGNMNPEHTHQTVTDEDPFQEESLPDEAMDTQPDFVQGQTEDINGNSQDLLINADDPASLEPEWIQLVEKYCNNTPTIRHPLPGIRINEPIQSEEDQNNELKWIEYAPGDFGLATGWPTADSDQTEGSHFEVGESSHTRPLVPLAQQFDREEMTAGTLTQMPHSHQMPHSSSNCYQCSSSAGPRPGDQFQLIQGYEEDLSGDNSSQKALNLTEEELNALTEQSFSTAYYSEDFTTDGGSEEHASIYLNIEDGEGLVKKRKPYTTQEAQQLIKKKAKVSHVDITVCRPHTKPDPKSAKRVRDIENAEAEISHEPPLKKRKELCPTEVDNTEPAISQDQITNATHLLKSIFKGLRETFSTCWVEVLPIAASDHSPLVTSRIANTVKGLTVWIKNEFGAIRTLINAVEKNLHDIQKNISNPTDRTLEFTLKKKLEFLLNCEEVMWAQRAQQSWLIKGDKNTRFFHTMMNGSKAPSPDGMPPIFFQHFWDIVGNDLIGMNAFVKDRSIHDNLILANEVLHYIKGCRKTKKSWAALKVDLHKAYDKISSDFLRDVLKYMNFPPMWCQLIMECVSTTTLRIKINGDYTDWFNPSAGPKICKQASPLNNLLYADDLLLFFKADPISFSSIDSIMHFFGEASGLFMNSGKSEIKFSPNTTDNDKNRLNGILNCTIVDNIGKYLGGYIDGANPDRKNASVIISHLQQKLFGWKASMLSQAARIQKNAKIVTDHLKWRVGNGESIQLSDSKWLQPDHPSLGFVKVSQLIIAKRFWDNDELSTLYNQDKAKQILHINVSYTNQSDKLIWCLSKHGKHEVRLAYKALSSVNTSITRSYVVWKDYWHLHLPYKILLFWWKLLHNGLPLRQNLIARGYRIDGHCPFGCDILVSEQHLFKDCQFAKMVWYGSNLKIRTDSITHNSIIDWINSCLIQAIQNKDSNLVNMVQDAISIIWSIYTQRNNVIFQNANKDPMEAIYRAQNIKQNISLSLDLAKNSHFFSLQDNLRKSPLSHYDDRNLGA